MAEASANQNEDHLEDKEQNVNVEMRCIVKGYQEYEFNVNTGEKFELLRKHGSRGRAFRVCNDRGQLGHLQRELVSLLWPLHNSTMKW